MVPFTSRVSSSAVLCTPKQCSWRAANTVWGHVGRGGRVKGASQPYRALIWFFGLAWVKFKGILALHVGWAGGRAEEQVVKGWQTCPASGSSSAKGAQHLQDTEKKGCSLLFIQAAPLYCLCFPYSPPQCSHLACSGGETRASSPHPGRNAMKPRQECP